MSKDFPGMSHRELLRQVQKIIPPLSEHFHKGQQGRVAVVGGSEDYTGAPYLSANASALLGADMSHVVCEPHAAQAIKSYSPNLMVHPYLRQQQLNPDSPLQPSEAAAVVDEVVDRVTPLLDRLHAIAIGPGLGRDPLMQSSAAGIIAQARLRQMPIVVDADGLYLVQNDRETVRGYAGAVLTPNAAEFARLCKVMDVGGGATADRALLGQQLARELGGVTVVQKGAKDYISNARQTIVCDVPGGLKRSGGQGDTLTGCLATFLGWKRAYQGRLWDHDNSLSDAELTALAAYGAAAVTRTCSRLAYEKKGRALQASDLSDQVPAAFNELFGDGDH